MQERHLNRKKYFEELSITSQKYYIPYLTQHFELTPECSILEIGCGDGGNLLPFAQYGCKVTGIDISINRIKQAQDFFLEAGLKAQLIASDIFKIDDFGKLFDIIVMHDVIEHIADKERLLKQLKIYVKDNGIIFIGFPAWQMPFGGHQQTCRNKIISHLPFIHLLPNPIYKTLLKAGNEIPEKVEELLDIKSCQITVEHFRKLSKKTGYDIQKETLYFINPHYEVKFGLKPRKLSPILSHIPYIRNYFTTSAFFLLKKHI
ncbi:class I SAM-dependent methyltransferase [Coprobacter secundus]|uniref:SAM-dependent methyltransferase n=1 Tax=Coprobacter secundus subsp. similis TaxID=2751153 RepID=A0A7G1HVV1_9BACT|nr:class I SAM-dependent methyltransferase [Coprobacter secundus]BCI63826.1 SAM-dependent methyltransferase [Coprobacter secundus subsp. similis]